MQAEFRLNRRTTSGGGAHSNVVESGNEGYKVITVRSMKVGSNKKLLDQSVWSSVFRTTSFLLLSVCVLLCGFSAMAQSESTVPGSETSTGQQLVSSVAPGTISGVVVDPSGATVAGARVELREEGRSTNEVAKSGDDGRFNFGNVAPGSFQLTVVAEGFAAQTLSGKLQEGEMYDAPRISLTLAAEKTEMRVVVPQAEVAEGQIREEEKQRVLGVVPNFYVSYVPDAAPLSARQKFELAWKTTVDPVSFVLTGAIAGGEQARDDFKAYGQGAQGYGKRFGAAYADSVTGVFIGSAILPSLLKQDPRYFYKGSGSGRSRVLYAIANAVICKGDNGRWQANYSNILGSLASGGISNLYYPAQDRSGAELTFENAAIEIGASAAANLLQEFVIRKFTPNVRNHDPAKP
jgi:carboxypeptidase family protein